MDIIKVTQSDSINTSLLKKIKTPLSMQVHNTLIDTTNRKHILLAKENETPLGFTIINKMIRGRTWDKFNVTKGHYILEYIHTVKENTAKGTASKMIDKAKEIAQSYTIFTEVGQYNIRSLNLFLSNGFRIIFILPEFYSYSKTKEDAYMLAWNKNPRAIPYIAQVSDYNNKNVEALIKLQELNND